MQANSLLVIVLRFLLDNKKMELIENGHALYSDNGPLKINRDQMVSA